MGVYDQNYEVKGKTDGGYSPLHDGGFRKYYCSNEILEGVGDNSAGHEIQEDVGDSSAGNSINEGGGAGTTYQNL